jgi:hypothetical protein
MFVKFINTILLCLCCAAAEISDANKQILVDRVFSKGDFESIALLLNSGLYTREISMYMTKYITSGDVHSINRILNSGARIDLGLVNWVLAARAENNQVEMVQLALKFGADKNLMLIHAMQFQRRAAVAHMLIDIGADVNAGDNVYSSVLLSCIRNIKAARSREDCARTRDRNESDGWVDLLKLILNQPNINTKKLYTEPYNSPNKKFLTAYQFAVENSCLEAIKIFDEYYLNKLKQ